MIVHVLGNSSATPAAASTITGSGFAPVCSLEVWGCGGTSVRVQATGGRTSNVTKLVDQRRR
jgi:hypothetical protein